MKDIKISDYKEAKAINQFINSKRKLFNCSVKTIDL
jgi:hypothetical protein